MLCSPRVHSEIQSQLSQWPTDIFPKWRSAPTPSSTRATSERSKCFKIAVWPQRGGGPHTPSLILLHISVGIVRIQKCLAVTGRPLWLERTHNALCCWCELLTAWAGPRQQRTAQESAAGWNIWHFSVMTALLLLSFCAVCILSMWTHVSPGNRKIWSGWQILSGSGLFWRTPPSEASAAIFKGCLTYAGRESILRGLLFNSHKWCTNNSTLCVSIHIPVITNTIQL